MTRMCSFICRLVPLAAIGWLCTTRFRPIIERRAAPRGATRRYDEALVLANRHDPQLLTRSRVRTRKV